MNKDIHDKFPHRWISPKAESKHSDIEGWGVFAKEDISKGEPVGVLGGVIVHKSRAREYWEIMDDVGIQIDDNFFIVPTTREELNEYGVYNHSCEPNVGYSNSITFVTMRDIKAGEELTFDYAFSESSGTAVHSILKCKCGLDSCRGEVHFDDWKRPELQEKYGKYFSPYLRERIGE